ncbi:type II toxin-antitoxin system HigB family toxin [Sphaerospermopsis aphanizomenoides]|nr:type II toxin-antitoxin system HigB family toxin [Sphaerospermopsis aphanizomenoides]
MVGDLIVFNIGGNKYRLLLQFILIAKKCIFARY